MSRTRAPGLSSVPTPSAPATSATIGQPGKDMSAAHGGRERHRRRLRPRPGPPQRGPGRSRLDGPATRHLRSVGSAHLVGLDDAGCRPAGGAGPGESLRRCGALSAAGALTSAARPRLGRGETPHVAQRQRRQQLDRIRLGDRHERGRVRTVRVRRADCRRSPRATRAFLRIPAPIPAANRGRTLRRGPDIRDRGSDRGPGSPGGGRCRPRAATTAGPGCSRRLRRRTAGRDRLAPPGDRSRQVRSVRPVAAVGQMAARHRRGPASASRARCAMPRSTTDDRVPGWGTGPLTSPDGTARPHRNGCRPAAITENTDQH
jgi:hypothetical protein